MALYGIRTKRGERLMTVMGGVTLSDDAGPGPAMERSLCLTASIVVGEFTRSALFCTEDLSLARLLLDTGHGPAVGDQATLRPPFGMTRDDLEVVNLVTRQAVHPETAEEDVEPAPRLTLVAA